MSRADTNIVSSLVDVADVYTRSSSKEGRCNIRCSYCKSDAKQVVADTARRWFVEHTCKNPAAAHIVTEPLQERDYTADLTQRDATVAWELMTEMLMRCERTYGGHRHGLEPPTGEQLEHMARVNSALVRILGGVPQPWPPTATIIPFPRQRELELAAA